MLTSSRLFTVASLRPPNLDTKRGVSSDIADARHFGSEAFRLRVARCSRRRGCVTSTPRTAASTRFATDGAVALGAVDRPTRRGGARGLAPLWAMSQLSPGSSMDIRVADSLQLASCHEVMRQDDPSVAIDYARSTRVGGYEALGLAGNTGLDVRRRARPPRPCDMNTAGGPRTASSSSSYAAPHAARRARSPNAARAPDPHPGPLLQWHPRPPDGRSRTRLS